MGIRFSRDHSSFSTLTLLAGSSDLIKPSLIGLFASIFNTLHLPYPTHMMHSLAFSIPVLGTT